MEELCSQLQKLGLLHKVSMATKNDEPVYCLNLAAQKTGGDDHLVAVSSSIYNIHLYKRSHMEMTNVLTGHSDVISAISFLHADPNLLISSSEDQTVRIWDPRTSLKKAVQRFAGEGNTRARLLSCDVNLSDRVVCAGTEKLNDSDAYLLFWDRRKDKLLGCYEDSHNDDVTQVHFHPTSEQRLLSGSTDGLVNVYDIGEGSEYDALLSTFNTEATVEKAGWCGPDARQVYCSTHMFTWHTWDSETNEDVKIIKDFAEKLEGRCSAQYVVDCFPAATSTSHEHLMVGNHAGDLHLLDLSDPEEIKVLRSLAGGHSDTVRCLHWDEEAETLVTGGEDSLLCLWSLNAEWEAPTPSKQGKAKGKKVSARKRSAPYSQQKLSSLA